MSHSMSLPVQKPKIPKSLPILQYPDPILATPSETIPDPTDPAINDLMLGMYATMLEKSAHSYAGLAAPQVGANLRMFFALGVLFINPQITWRTNQVGFFDEACFSLSNANEPFRVKRPTSIRMKWQDQKGNWYEDRFNGYKAEVIQHEYSHLDGITIKDEGWKIPVKEKV